MSVLFREGLNAVDECVWMTSFGFVSDARVEFLPSSEVLRVCAVPRGSLRMRKVCGN